MRKKLLSIVFCALIFTQPVCAPASAAEAGMNNFQKRFEYDDSVFSDVAGRWFENDVKTAYEYGLTEGVGGGLFVPDERISVAEAIVMAARINSVYYGKKIYSEPGAWYTKYIKYALGAGIIRSNQFNRYNRDATRQEIAVMFYKALPMFEYPGINAADMTITDLKKDATDAGAVYSLYRAGVLTGYPDGSFRPKDTITRAEVAVILARVTQADKRVVFNPAQGE
ncbi:MAG: S-layer homology domain-containing protein, partial [Oscillospiraceae bacterium]|nr:S-layer homology domain-containing protein [Oscillospiraceae bacterium]